MAVERSRIERALAHDRSEFLGFLQRRTGSRELSEDLLHDALMRAFGQLESLRDEAALKPWFYRVLRNALSDHRRRQRVAGAKLRDFAVEHEHVGQPGPEPTACACITLLMPKLKPEYAEALRAVEVASQPVKEFAHEARISASNAAVRVFRARAALREQVLRACGACAGSGCGDCTCAPA